MIKRSPSRNYKSKGIKLKHVLQICLLLGVCFWLIYQVKHSHDKKKEYDEKDAKTSIRTQSGDQILKFGRKDLPRVAEVTKNEHEEEEEEEAVVEDEENKHEEQEKEKKNEVEEREDGNQHEVEEREEEEKKSEETEDDGRGGGDDEIDESEQEKSEAEADRDEEFIDEEKEREEGFENETEKNEDEEKEGSVDNQNAHEAREENYKGDDASSAVAHDTQTESTETEKVSSQNSNANLGISILEQEHKPNGTEVSNRNDNDMDVKVTEGERTKTGPSLNATAGEEIGNISLSTPLDGSHPNTTTLTNNVTDHLEASSNLTALVTEASPNATVFTADTSGSFQAQQNRLEIQYESVYTHNATVHGTVTGDVTGVQTEEIVQNNNTVSKEGQSESNSTASVRAENGYAAEGESSSSYEPELIIRLETTNGAGNNSGLSDTNGTTDATEDKKSKGNRQTEETEQSSDSSGEGTSNTIQHDPIDFSDSQSHQDEVNARTDLDTLPDIRTEGDNNEETAAE
ncbi:dentin sialophosphoprotein-like [Quillaja saponaria]|uniref:Dentin sialophosphoprotein-like n=1 Tax=Quillaja saponaria TaxID=32244 RepID=A0AAD7P8C7_QUISA|nr:dentin sialophosphoprotein-like [Quillaja saponaria]KAJ7946213.1 dentin sialophosphoprotein-like [Quillaja saponaria]